MTIRQQGGVFGRNPKFNNVEVEGDLNVGGNLVINGEAITGLDFEGSWNASTNSPDLTAITPNVGQFWIVSVAGNTSLGGITNWGVGDWALYDGSAWQRIEGGGDGNFVNLSATGTSDLSGPVVVNDQAGDNDFRVETQNNPNMLFSDASADKLGINSTTLNATANVGTYNVWEDENQVYSDNIKRLQIMEKACTTGVAEDFFSVSIPGRIGGLGSYRTKGLFEIELHVRGDGSHEGGFVGKYILAYRNGDSYIGLSASITTIMEIGTAPTLAANVVGDVITFTVQLPSYVPQHDRLVTAWLYNKDRYLDVTQL